MKIVLRYIFLLHSINVRFAISNQTLPVEKTPSIPLKRASNPPLAPNNWIVKVSFHLHVKLHNKSTPAGKDHVALHLLSPYSRIPLEPVILLRLSQRY